MDGTEYLSTTPVRRGMSIVLPLKIDESSADLNFKVTKTGGNIVSSPSYTKY